MRQRLLEYLACPECQGDLALHEGTHEGDHILSGDLSCAKCKRNYPIRGGVPRFAEQIGEVDQKTAEAFGYEWTNYSELDDRYRQQFLDWIKPVTPEFFRGKAVLEGGCGKGRHTALVAAFGARDIVALDLSIAVETAFANTKHLPNAHIVQADVTKPPVKRMFDHAFSIGVLHHLPDPEKGFHALVSRLEPDGHISGWVYGREGNGWIVHIVTPMREHVTSKLPHGVLDVLSAVATLPLFLATRLLYGPLKGKGLPYGPYLAYISPFPFREQRSIVFDHLVAPVACYLRKDEFADWFKRAGMTDVRIEHHNANSWRGFARLRGDR